MKSFNSLCICRTLEPVHLLWLPYPSMFLTDLFILNLSTKTKLTCKTRNSLVCDLIPQNQGTKLAERTLQPLYILKLAQINASYVRVNMVCECFGKNKQTKTFQITSCEKRPGNSSQQGFGEIPTTQLLCNRFHLHVVYTLFACKWRSDVG